MKDVREIFDPDPIRRTLERDPYLHLYELGDLDPFFWPRTRWFQVGEAGTDAPVALLYDSESIPVLLLFHRRTEGARVLLDGIRGILPSPLYTHLSPGLFDLLEPRFRILSQGLQCKMSLRHPDRLQEEDDRAARPEGPRNREIGILGRDQLAELEALYAESYPGNWFEERMLGTGRYFGVREYGELVAVAGVHVYSPAERIGVLGNVTTRPDRRGRGLAREACRALCRTLQEEGMRVGLNVARSNTAAIRCYRALGFVHEADYEERLLEDGVQVSRESE